MAFGLELMIGRILEVGDLNATILMLRFQAEYTQAPHFNVNVKVTLQHLAFFMESGNVSKTKNFAKVKVGIQTSSKFMGHYFRTCALAVFCLHSIRQFPLFN